MAPIEGQRSKQTAAATKLESVFRGRHIRKKKPATLATESKIRALFDEIDTDNSGTLSKHEVKKLAGKMGHKLASMFGGSKKLDAVFLEGMYSIYVLLPGICRLTWSRTMVFRWRL